MLSELNIRNFVLIEDASLELGEGLTVLSGETGAGKTLLTQALELLLGERAAEGMVGASGDEALIQAIFEMGEDEFREIPDDVADQAGLSPGELIATRRLSRSGRNRCYLNGTAASLSTLGASLAHMVSFSGQHEHRRLVEASYQKDMLDAFAGERAGELRRSLAERWQAARNAEELLAERHRDRAARVREKELLEFQTDELRKAALSLEEEQALTEEQRALARAEEILRSCAEAAALLSSEEDQTDAGTLTGMARRHMDEIRDVDTPLEDLAAQVAECEYLLKETARNVRTYADGVEVNPARLHEVEERLQEYTALARKYGGSTEQAISFLEEAEGRLAALEEQEAGLDDLQRERDENRAAAVALAEELSALRTEAAPRLADAVESHLADLGMPEGRFVVRLESGETWEDLQAHGADSVEFLVSANLGHPPRSLARTASGGELSRVLLALKVALAGLESHETIVLDEIDAGIGGHTALAVGRKLRELAEECQVLVITHLPQLAAFADAHYVIEKEVRGEGTATKLRSLNREEAVQELSRMMGGEADDSTALDHARSLRDRAVRGLVD